MDTKAAVATTLFAELHDLYGAQAGVSAWREAADGLVKRREVRACSIATQAALEYACQRMDADEAATLRAAFATGEALLFSERLRAKRHHAALGPLRIGLASEVRAHRLYPIAQFTNLQPLYT